MKIKNITLTIKETKTVLHDFATTLAAARKNKKVRPHEGLSFQNIDTLRKVLTKKRLELLHAIRKNAPDSIYKLAKIVKRDLKSVNTDIDVLADLGLISLEKLAERQKTKPKVEYDRLQVEIAI